MSDWHGWSVGGRAYHVGRYPTRKSVALYYVDGCVSDVAAYFRSEDEAQAFLAWLDKLALTTHVGVPA